MNTKLLTAILILGLLTACGTQATPVPASPPTEKPALPTPTSAPTDTAIPPTDTALPPTDTAIPPTETSAAAQAVTTGATVSFANDILPLLESRCKNCHGGNRTEEGLVLLTYADVMKGSESGPVVVPGNANDSLLAELVVSQDMPKRGPKLTPAQAQLIVDWINQGALDN